MREIEFRLWDKDKKLLGYERLKDGRWVYNFDDLKEWFEGFKYLNQIKFRDQFIGLKDRNGKKIFQEDIFKCVSDKEGYGDTSYEGLVLVVPKICGYKLKMLNPKENHDSTSLWHIEDDNGKNIKLVGNRLENPELLKEDTQ